MAKKATKANTGLIIGREVNKFTASWKIKTSNATSQSLRYRTHNGTTWGDWTTKTLNKGSNTYSFTLDASASIKQIQVQTKIRRTPTSEYKASDWASSSKIYQVEAPPAPVLSLSKDSANKSTFSWAITTDDKDHAWFYRCYYRTKCTTTPDSDSDWGAWTYASTSSYTYTDNTLGTTRIFQLKAVGPGGESEVQTLRHVITTAPVATWSSKDPVSYTTQSSYYNMTYSVNISGSTDTVDSIVPQYYIGTPTSSMACPNGVSFSDGTTYNYSDGKTDYTLAITTSALVDDDECLWAQVKTIHDSVESVSTAYRVITGKLTAPTATVSMGAISASGFSVTVNITNAGTDVPGAYAEVYLEKSSRSGQYVLIGTVPNGESSATISSSIDLTHETGYGIHVRNVTADGKSMTSPYYDYTSSIPQAPILNSVALTSTAGKVFLSWTNRWANATGAEIAWTDDQDNWMSNDAPETFEIEEVASGWYITGLETGKTWYFRVRSVLTDDDVVSYSAWSQDVPIDLSSAPATPVLYLSEEAITEDDMVTAYWSYVTTDGTPQLAADIVTVTLSNGSWVPGSPIGSTTAAQHIDIYAKKQGWTNGQTKYLALRTRSGSGGQSDYSTPVQLDIAAKPTVSITTTSLAASDTVTEYFEGDGSTNAFVCSYALSGSPTVKVNGTTKSASYSGDTVTVSSTPASGATVAITYSTASNKVLKVLPLTATVTTANAADLTLAIERASSYPMLRPDGTEPDGAEGETIYAQTISAGSSNSFSITAADLLEGGRLDDGASYNLVATVTDKYKQKAEARIEFKVHWTHQAWKPAATFETDTTNYSVKITPATATGYASGDTCDIYRLGIDKPELIYKGATFGTAYVDPYPAFGANSGYKVVTVTPNKDYITAENTFAEYDTTEDGGYTQLDPGLLVIDFDSNRVELPYNITLDNSWSKDFERTAYLGGHVAGDHNKAVTRDLTAGTVIARKLDTETAELMRRLARYTGICHVRTPEGSSFAADVQVSESRAFDSGVASYTLTIQKVDTVGFDAMTYEEWSESQ